VDRLVEDALKSSEAKQVPIVKDVTDLGSNLGGGKRFISS